MLRRLVSLPLLVSFVVLAALAGCGLTGGSSGKLHQLGERVQVGPIVYTILEADWLAELGTEGNTRTPQARFLLVRASITNSGNRELNIPLFSLEDSEGKSFMELQEGESVEEWLGILRSVGPAETLQGRLLFDVTPGDYRLRLSDGGEPDSERLAYVRIPLKIKESGALATPIEGK